MDSFLWPSREVLTRCIGCLLGGFILLGGSARGAKPSSPGISAGPQAYRTSPVSWMSWGESAFVRAQQEQKPIFVFIGSATSELSRAMRLQTFAHADTAALLNQNFVCVLVEREEHPELVALYQSYLSEVKQLTGQPLNLWLTPELLPYEGAAYLPPTEEWGKTSFLKIAQQAATAWTTDAGGCRARATEAVTQLSAVHQAVTPAILAPDILSHKLAAAAAAGRARLAEINRGLAAPPLAPGPEFLRFLLQRSPADRAAALGALREIVVSPLRDPLDGGFFRYATDARWRLPYAQKNLADQARITLALLDAAAGDESGFFAAAARGALDYVLTRLAQPGGTYAAGEDATGEEFVGYYAWTATEIDAALGAAAAGFKIAHGVEAAGNISAEDDLSGKLKGRNLLRGSPETEHAAAARLRVVRDLRPAPLRQETATARTHGLLLAALARAGGELKQPLYRQAATQLLAVVEKEFFLSSSGELRHLRGANTPAGPADYAALALGYRELARAEHRPELERLAAQWLALANEQFLDPISGLYYATPAVMPAGVFFRPLAQDEAPSAEALALLAGLPLAQRSLIAAGLAATLEAAAAPASGDVLLALAQLP